MAIKNIISINPAAEGTGAISFNFPGRRIPDIPLNFFNVAHLLKSASSGISLGEALSAGGAERKALIILYGWTNRFSLPYTSLC
jgi:hypothetical protein